MSARRPTPLPFVSSEVETRSAKPTSLDYARDERLGEEGSHG